jgi:hypothetical protein
MIRFLSLAAALLLLTGCSRRAEPTPNVVVVPQPAAPPDDAIPPPRPVSPRFPDEPFARGVAYLLKQQSPDGAWRSDVYATFKDGTALTPLALCTLLDAADAGLNPTGSAEARKKAVAWLAKLVKPDGTINSGPDGFDYPIYTAALTVRALSHAENADHRKARDAWVKYIKERQLTERLGWKPEEKQYGGWGYCRVIPKKPEPNKFAPPLIESNVSATLFALEALSAADALDAEAAKAAAVFVRRCQGDDGGFHFIYDDPVRNKAGSPDPPGAKGARFHSYGSTTADGFRAFQIVRYDHDEDSSRDLSARKWLVKHFRADTHPGEYVKAHEPNREAVYYYYTASVAKALRDMKVEKAGGVDWAAELAAELKKRQRDDGSWANPIELVRENDPIVATCNAVSTLAKCR